MIKNSSGFTIIELLVVVTVMLLFSGMSLASYNSFTNEKEIEQETQKLIDVLELTRQKALAAEKTESCYVFDGYRIKFDSNNQYNLELCCNGQCCDGTNGCYPSAKYESKLNITTSPDNYVLFRPLNRGANDIIIEINSPKISKCGKISVNKAGLIEELDCKL